jgi:hypothetical protein
MPKSTASTKHKAQIEEQLKASRSSSKAPTKRLEDAGRNLAENENNEYESDNDEFDFDIQ